MRSFYLYPAPRTSILKVGASCERTALTGPPSPITANWTTLTLRERGSCASQDLNEVGFMICTTLMGGRCRTGHAARGDGHARDVARYALRFLYYEFFIDNLLVRIHFIIVVIRWTGLAPWEFEFRFPGHAALGDSHARDVARHTPRHRLQGQMTRGVQGLGFTFRRKQFPMSEVPL